MGGDTPWQQGSEGESDVVWGNPFSVSASLWCASFLRVAFFSAECVFRFPSELLKPPRHLGAGAQPEQRLAGLRSAQPQQGLVEWEEHQGMGPGRGDLGIWLIKTNGTILVGR